MRRETPGGVGNNARTALIEFLLGSCGETETSWCASMISVEVMVFLTEFIAPQKSHVAGVVKR